MVHRFEARDGEDPGEEVRATLEPGELSPRHEARLLHHLVDIGPSRQLRAQKRPHLTFVRNEKANEFLVERAGVVGERGAGGHAGLDIS